jgi:Transglutaminase-like superfamily
LNDLVKAKMQAKTQATIQSWRTYWALNHVERAIARSAALALTATWIGLRLFGFKRWKQIVTRRIETSEPRCLALSANRILQLQTAAARHLFFHANCLEQSLVLWMLLRRHGFAADLKIGARKEAGRFEAHAWVELNRVPLNDQTDSNRQFVPFDRAISSLETQPE